MKIFQGKNEIFLSLVLSFWVFLYLNIWWKLNFNFLTVDDALSVVLAFHSAEKKDIPIHPYATGYEGLLPQILILREFVVKFDKVASIRVLSALVVSLGFFFLLLVSRKLKIPKILLFVVFILSPHQFIRPSLQGFLIYPATFFWISLFLLSYFSKKSFLTGVFSGLATYTHPFGVFTIIPALLKFPKIKVLFGFLLGTSPTLLFNIANLDYTTEFAKDVLGLPFKVPPIIMDAYFIKNKLTSKHAILLLSENTFALLHFCVYVCLAILGLAMVERKILLGYVLGLLLAYEERYFSLIFPQTLLGVSAFLKKAGKGFSLLLLPLFFVLNLSLYFMKKDGYKVLYKYRWFDYPAFLWKDDETDLLCLKNFLERVRYKNVVADLSIFFLYRAYFSEDGKIYYYPDSPIPQYFEFSKLFKPKNKDEIEYELKISFYPIHARKPRKICDIFYISAEKGKIKFPKEDRVVAHFPDVLKKFWEFLKNPAKIKID